MRCSKKATDNKTANKSEKERKGMPGSWNQRTTEDWKMLSWTDESKPESLVHHTGFLYIAQCVAPTVKHVGGSMMDWSCFAGSWVGELNRVRDILEDLKCPPWRSPPGYPGSSSSRKINKEKTTKPKLKQNYLRNKEQERMLENTSVNKNLEESGCSKTSRIQFIYLCI